MRKFLPRGLLFAACCTLFASVAAKAAATDDATETRDVALDARVVRVKIDGVIHVRLRQGDTPSLKIVGDKRLMDKMTSSQAGDTLNLQTDNARGVKVSGAGVRVELVLPALRQVVADGVGSTDISGFGGQELELLQDGAGSMRATVDYKIVHTTLAGVGSMRVWLGDNDRTEIDLRGAGNITLSGRSKLLKASLGGVGGLTAQQFDADAVEVDLSGLGNASVRARQAASLKLSGLGSVTVFGQPASRAVSVNGLGKVNWK